MLMSAPNPCTLSKSLDHTPTHFSAFLTQKFMRNDEIAPAWAIHAMLLHQLNTTTLSFLSPLSPSFPLRPHLRPMLSTLENPPLRPTQTGYPPWDALEPAVVLNPQEPVYSNSGSHDTVPVSYAVVDERVRRRRLSNRESARRSRMRKQKHLENLRNELNRLRLMNRELLNRVMLAVHQGQLVRGENERLRAEAAILRRRLCYVRRDLLFRQLQHHFSPSTWQYCNDVTSINGQLPQLASLINH